MLFNATLDGTRLLIAIPIADPGDYDDTDGDGVIDECDACSGTNPNSSPISDDGCGPGK